MSVRQYLTEQYILYKVQNGEIEIKVLREICKQKLKVSHILFQKSINRLIPFYFSQIERGRSSSC